MISDELIGAVRGHEALLFVGAGVSRTLGLPSFDELAMEMARDLDFDADVFRTFGELPTLAEYYRLEKQGFGPLRSRLDAAWHGELKINIKDSDIHRLITKMNFPLIYTTNWDRWLEKAHDAWAVEYTKIATVADLTKTKNRTTQIVKFHGDFSDDSSMVFGESSYLARMDFSSPLDIKLRADTLGRTILFLGYSLVDVNTRLLLFRLAKLWKDAPSARPHSYLVMGRPNPVQERVLKEWGVTYLVAERGDDETERLSLFLGDLANSAFQTDFL